jgi:hypothetical protein
MTPSQVEQNRRDREPESSQKVLTHEEHDEGINKCLQCAQISGRAVSNIHPIWPDFLRAIRSARPSHFLLERNACLSIYFLICLFICMSIYL